MLADALEEGPLKINTTFKACICYSDWDKIKSIQNEKQTSDNRSDQYQMHTWTDLFADCFL